MKRTSTGGSGKWATVSMALLVTLNICSIALAGVNWHNANKARELWLDNAQKDQAWLDTITSGVEKSDDARVEAIDKGRDNSKMLMILGEDNRGLDSTVSAIFENDKLVMLEAESGSGDSEVKIRYYLENEKDPLVVAHTEVRKDGPAPHKETYRWYFAGGEYVGFRFSNPEEGEKFSPPDRAEDIAKIRSQIAEYLRLLDSLKGSTKPSSLHSA